MRKSVSRWAVFRNFYTDELHVMPVDELGHILPPHELRYRCPCSPRRDDEQSMMVIHEDKERGGLDS
jgi:hypothetical protein